MQLCGTHRTTFSYMRPRLESNARFAALVGQERDISKALDKLT
jgi:hypothetical protein